VNDRTRAQDPGSGKPGSPTSADACILTRDRDSRRLRLLLSHDSDQVFGQPSTYSLDQITLAHHIRTLRRSGWQAWEIRARFYGAA